MLRLNFYKQYDASQMISHKSIPNAYEPFIETALSALNLF